MKIQIIQSIAGHEQPIYDLADFSFAPGSIVEVHDALAEAWIASGIAIAGKKGDKVTMPVEAFTYRRKPVPVAPLASAASESIDYEKAALFLRSRGYFAETPEDARAFVDKLREEQRPGFLEELSKFQISAQPVEPATAEPEVPVAEPIEPAHAEPEAPVTE